MGAPLSVIIGTISTGLIRQGKMMKIITLLAIVAFATALPSTTDEVVPEVELAQASAAFNHAKAEVTALIQSGKDQGACEDLAAATIKEVEDAVDGQQDILNSLDKGTNCPNEGQAEVDAAQTHLNNANKANSDAQAALATAMAAPIQVGAVPYDSLTEGQCGFFFEDSAFTAAKATAEAAKKAASEAAAAAAAASTALEAAKEQQKKDILACQCKVKADYATAWETANSNNAENQETYTKGKHMECVLAGTAYSACDAGTAPTVKHVTLADGVEDANCAVYKHISYVGCFGDNGARDLKHGPKNYGYSPRTCMDACSQYKYFALQNGGWCDCDNTYSDNYSGSGGKGNYNAIGGNACDKDGANPGRGMGGGWANAVYTLKESHHSTSEINFADEMVPWTNNGGCSLHADYAHCKQGNYQSRTKLAYSAPITVTLEMKQVGGGSDECGDFQVFGRVNERHSGYNAGMGWWTHYTGFGYNSADGHNQWALKDGSSQRWRQFTISVHTNGVATFWLDGQKYATKQGSASSGHLSIGVNCRNYQYRLMRTSRNNW